MVEKVVGEARAARMEAARTVVALVVTGGALVGLAVVFFGAVASGGDAVPGALGADALASAGVVGVWAAWKRGSSAPWQDAGMKVALAAAIALLAMATVWQIFDVGGPGAVPLGAAVAEGGFLGEGLGRSGLAGVFLGSSSSALAAVCTELGVLGLLELYASYLVLAMAAGIMACCAPEGIRPAVTVLTALLILQCSLGIVCAVGAFPGQAPLPFVSLAGWQSAIPFATTGLLLAIAK